MSDQLDLTPIDMECIRCQKTEAMRFYGMCTACRDELYARFDAEGRVIDVADYEPTMHVTPNAVALKDD